VTEVSPRGAGQALLLKEGVAGTIDYLIFTMIISQRGWLIGTTCSFVPEFITFLISLFFRFDFNRFRYFVLKGLLFTKKK
jgi:hypothetical protein